MLPFQCEAYAKMRDLKVCCIFSLRNEFPKLAPIRSLLLEELPSATSHLRYFSSNDSETPTVVNQSLEYRHLKVVYT